MAKVAAVILAAGESARFGKPKQFLRFRGKTLLRRIVDAAKTDGGAKLVAFGGVVIDNVEDDLDTRRVKSLDQRSKFRIGIGV